MREKKLFPNMASSLHEITDPLNQRIAELEQAVQGFLEKYDELMPHVINDRAFCQNHHMPWDWDNWEMEIERLRALVKKDE